MAYTSWSPGARWRRGKTSPSTIRATRIWRSRWARPIATCPHIYGVSYFSSKGPTGDGRLKPDIVAPGEKIISCQSGQAGAEGEVASPGASKSARRAGGARRTKPPAGPDAICARYKEDSGTSMAAPHVSGVIAAFLSERLEFIGKPEAVTDIFLSTATDLKRTVYFQGKGLVDLMRAIQSV